MGSIKTPGLYSSKRRLSDSIKADETHLENAPLLPKDAKRLADRIAYEKAELKKVNAQIREESKNK